MSSIEGPLHLKIEGATVVDGTGRPGARADVGIRDETIVAVGDLSRERAGSQLHAAGKVVTPGFIDMHSHSDWRLWGNRRAESKIRQGVTTEVVGNCGFSPAPVATEFVEDLRAFALFIPTGMDFAWRSVGDYLRAFDRDGTALNVVQLVGAGTLRIAAMGFARRPPTAAELTTMQRIMGNAMNEGRRKRRAKDLDFIVVNDATEPGAGFAVDTNRVTIIGPDDSEDALPLLSKREVADAILDRVEAVLNGR